MNKMKTTITVVRSGFGNVADECWFDQKYSGGLPYHEKEVELPEGLSVVDDGAEPIGATCYAPEGDIAVAYTMANKSTDYKKCLFVESNRHLLKFEL